MVLFLYWYFLLICYLLLMIYFLFLIVTLCSAMILTKALNYYWCNYDDYWLSVVHNKKRKTYTSSMSNLLQRLHHRIRVDPRSNSTNYNAVCQRQKNSSIGTSKIISKHFKYFSLRVGDGKLTFFEWFGLLYSHRKVSFL